MRYKNVDIPLGFRQLTVEEAKALKPGDMVTVFCPPGCEECGRGGKSYVYGDQDNPHEHMVERIAERWYQEFRHAVGILLATTGRCCEDHVFIVPVEKSEEFPHYGFREW